VDALDGGGPTAGSSAAAPLRRLRRERPPAGRRLSRPPDRTNIPLTPEQRLLVLDAWRRSGLPAGDFAPLVGISKHTLYAWKHKFDAQGPAGLLDHPRGAPTGSRLPEVTRRAILMLKEANPDWGCERIAALLLRGPALPASPEAVARVLREAGYELEEAPTRRHPDHPRSFGLRPADRVIDGCGLIPLKGGHHHGPRQSAGRAEGTAVAALDSAVAG
jgi:transposase